MNDEKLIECVREYELLYNLRHPKYMDSMKKEMAWKKISEQVKQPAVACKQRWQALRDAYRRAVNKKKGKTGKASKFTKKWKYENEMSFVTSFFVGRKTLEPDELKIESEDPSNDDEILEIQNPKKAKEMSKSPQVLPVDATSAVLMARLLDEQKKLPQRELDELDRFFLNISDTVKKFTPYLQAVAKNQIFSLVSEMELQQLAPPSSTSSQFPYISSPASASSSVHTCTTPIPTSPKN